MPLRNVPIYVPQFQKSWQPISFPSLRYLLLVPILASKIIIRNESDFHGPVVCPRTVSLTGKTPIVPQIPFALFSDLVYALGFDFEELFLFLSEHHSQKLVW